MESHHGVGIGRKLAIGKILVMAPPLPEPLDTPLEGSATDAKEKLKKAVAQVSDDLKHRLDKAHGEAKAVLEAQVLMAEDPTIFDAAAQKIDGGVNPGKAVFDTLADFQVQYASLGEYFAARVADLADISQRIRAAVTGVEVPGIPESDEPFILLAHDLAPADTATLDPSKVLALVTREGGPTSHTAILARSFGIPALVGVHDLDTSDALSGKTAIVDPISGDIRIDPSAEEIAAAEAKLAEQIKAASGPKTPGALADGTKVLLLANVGSGADVPGAQEAAAEGVGLFRTEFLFLSSKNAPSVEKQKEEYKKVLAGFPGQKVTVRLLDAGADKPLDFLNPDKEENPALGLRGYRALAANPQILRDQLTALKQAEEETEAEVWVMAPMISDLAESIEFVKVAKEIGHTQVGIMAEVPSLALIADKIAPHVDFFSIGTNDLTQYTFAADRLLGSVANFQDAWHPAVLKLIKSLGDAGGANSISVGVCGEAASDPIMAVVLVGLGCFSLSMSANAIADVRSELKKYDLETAKKAATAALDADSAVTARDAAMKVLGY
ncbi:MAG: phosphoenolpyruvate--protein phosphotransferase [Microbacteriaceae bacterium]|nr:phosphoenolpyruvate--protein phosphotransferase [Microbacteriaceae bacterium]